MLSRVKIQHRKLQIKNTETKHNPEQQTTQNTLKQNYPGLVTCYDTRPGNEVGLNAHDPTLYNNFFKGWNTTENNVKINDTRQKNYTYKLTHMGNLCQKNVISSEISQPFSGCSFH